MFLLCVLGNCEYSSRSKEVKAKINDNNITFHRFPVDEERKKIWLDRLNLQPSALKARSVLVCSEHFRPEDIYKKCVASKWKVFLNPDAIPLKWADDPRNIPRNDLKNDPNNDLEQSNFLNETDIKVEPEQISYTNASEIFIVPKNEPAATATVKLVEAQSVPNEVNMRNTHGILQNEPIRRETDKSANKFAVVENDIVPGTSEILWELRSRNEKIMKLQNKILKMRREYGSLQKKIKRRDRKINLLKEKLNKLEKDKSIKKSARQPSSPESTSTESAEEMNELEEFEFEQCPGPHSGADSD
ncbi:uncharacterized protein LOC129805392 [Phlebotomus papatasi]|uniref:uncharacterized protein LOC129805392 n=1 Tax=Phlebotomus papatasi TaxID=29031 RepID=UPI002483D9B0|nr:uncharacterized protein LOC129805392 [Phlebotomus papatasi]